MLGLIFIFSLNLSYMLKIDKKKLYFFHNSLIISLDSIIKFDPNQNVVLMTCQIFTLKLWSMFGILRNI